MGDKEKATINEPLPSNIKKEQPNDTYVTDSHNDNSDEDDIDDTSYNATTLESTSNTHDNSSSIETVTSIPATQESMMYQSPENVKKKDKEKKKKKDKDRHRYQDSIDLHHKTPKKRREESPGGTPLRHSSPIEKENSPDGTMDSQLEKKRKRKEEKKKKKDRDRNKERTDS